MLQDRIDKDENKERKEGRKEGRKEKCYDKECFDLGRK